MDQNVNTSLKNVACHFLRLLKLKVTESSLKKAIEENPYYPSLLSLSDTFHRYHINNNAFEITGENLGQIAPPYVAYVHFKGIGNDFVLVKEVNNETITYLYNSKKSKTISFEHFLEQYQNIIWLAEPDAHSGDPDYYKKLKLERVKKAKTITLISIGIIVMMYLFLNAFDQINKIEYCCILILKIIGFITSILLLQYDIEKDNPILQVFCGGGEKSNCGAVLSSKASKIAGISWSEIGLFYFSSTMLWIISPTFPFAYRVEWIALANIFTIPYILFSIYFQWKIIKQMCPLCLIVQAVLLLELPWGIINFWQLHVGLKSNIHNTIYFILLLFIPILFWYALKPILLKAKEGALFESAFKRIQYNPEIFRSLLISQPKAPQGWQHLGIDIGKAEATTTIIKVCNPYCGPCAKAHPELKEIIRRDNNIKLKIIFTARNEENDDASIIVKHLLASADENNVTKTQQSLDDWYQAEKKDYTSFILKHPCKSDLKEHNSKIEAMAKWCDEAKILHTPTIFLSGYKMPESYTLEQLKNILINNCLAKIIGEAENL